MLIVYCLVALGVSIGCVEHNKRNKSPEIGTGFGVFISLLWPVLLGYFLVIKIEEEV